MKKLYIILFLATLVFMGCSSKEQPVPPKQLKAMETKSKAPSFEELKSACLAGKGEACFSIGEQFYASGKLEAAKIFYREALQVGDDRGYLGIFQVECNGDNNAKSCYLLAVSLEERKNGINPNPALVFDYYKKAYNLGYTDATSLLAHMYNVAGDYFQAAKLYEYSCKNNSDHDTRMEACYNTGNMFNFGKGVRQDYQQARKFYKKACDGNYASACTNLGYLFGRGLGVRQDIYKAQRLYGKGCDGGHQMGCDNYRKNNNQGRR